MTRLALILAAAASLAGCTGGGDDGINHAAVQSAQAPLKAAAVKAGGDWSKMSPADQKLFLDRARGNVAAAQQMASFMAAPPGGPHK